MTCRHLDFDEYFEVCNDCGKTVEELTALGHCENCGSLDTRKNSSGEVSCDNCGWFEGDE